MRKKARPRAPAACASHEKRAVSGKRVGRSRPACRSGRADRRPRKARTGPGRAALKPRKPRRKRPKADLREARLDERPDVGEEAGRGEGADRPPCESPGSRSARYRLAGTLKNMT